MSGAPRVAAYLYIIIATSARRLVAAGPGHICDPGARAHSRSRPCTTRKRDENGTRTGPRRAGERRNQHVVLPGGLQRGRRASVVRAGTAALGTCPMAQTHASTRSEWGHELACMTFWCCHPIASRRATRTHEGSNAHPCAHSSSPRPRASASRCHTSAASSPAAGLQDRQTRAPHRLTTSAGMIAEGITIPQL